VLHIRNLHPEATEQDVTSLALPFGQVERIFMLKGKNQAFVQMQNVSDATAVIQFYSQVQAAIRGKPCYVQYSSHTELTVPQEEQETPNHILLVSVINLVYPVTIDILHQVFSKYGSIKKIIIFSKKGFQSLIEFTDRGSAQTAKQTLDGQNIYSGCCTLKIRYSNFSTLNVKYNNDKSRDFTDNTLPTGIDNPAGAMGMGLFGDATGWSGAPLHPYAAHLHGHHMPFTGGVVGGMGTAPYKGMHLSHPGMGGSSSIAPASNVLIVNNLNPERVTPDQLFTLFGVYGDVLRVKILYQKTDTALIMFSSSLGAETALTHLNGIPLHGKALTINFSKHNTVSLPREAEGSHLTKDYTGSSLHRYKLAGSKNFQHICPPCNMLHISNLPYSEGTGKGIAEEEITTEFAKHGRVVGFKFFAKDPRMALIEMGSVADAIEALTHMHDHRFGDNNIRVSFSKSTL